MKNEYFSRYFIFYILILLSTKYKISHKLLTFWQTYHDIFIHRMMRGIDRLYQFLHIKFIKFIKCNIFLRFFGFLTIDFVTHYSTYKSIKALLLRIEIKLLKSEQFMRYFKFLLYDMRHPRKYLFYIYMEWLETLPCIFKKLYGSIKKIFNWFSHNFGTYAQSSTNISSFSFFSLNQKNFYLEHFLLLYVLSEITAYII